MAFFRATESIRPHRQRLFADPFATCFLRAPLRRAVALARVPLLAKLVDWYADHRAPGARTSAIARTKFIDDAVLSAVRGSISQVVILGAGFDSRGHRLSELQSTTVFEVDHPNTLDAKLSLLQIAQHQLPANVHFVRIDFNQQQLADILTPAGFQTSLPAVFVWEGVTNYLTLNAVNSVLRYIRACALRTQVIFTYVDAGVLDGSADFPGATRLLSDLQKIGEPWTFGIHPRDLGEFLAQRGFSLTCDLSASDYRAKYFGAAARRMTGYEFYHVAVAQVQNTSV